MNTIFRNVCLGVPPSCIIEIVEALVRVKDQIKLGLWQYQYDIICDGVFHPPAIRKWLVSIEDAIDCITATMQMHVNFALPWPIIALIWIINVAILGQAIQLENIGVQELVLIKLLKNTLLPPVDITLSPFARWYWITW